jgi:hypothetical protein
MMNVFLLLSIICIFSFSVSQRTASASGCGKGNAKKYVLPEETGAKCMDGSLPAFYFRKGKGEGIRKWLIYFEGGGWCFDLELCQTRSSTVLGSSKDYPNCISEGKYGQLVDFLSIEPKGNPLFHNWNIVFVKYCDASSYAGEADLQYQGRTMYFRGRINRDETIRYLLNHLSMNTASEVAISGCSAGGLAIYLGIDQMADIIRNQNPQTVIRGISFSGFFLDYSTIIKAPKTKDDGVWDGYLDYGMAMRNIFQWMNISAGANPHCIQSHISHSQNLTNCIFARHLAPHLSTPVFSIQVRLSYHF